MFWAYKNFSLYLAVSGVDVYLAEGHFQRNGDMEPTLKFCRKFARRCCKTPQ